MSGGSWDYICFKLDDAADTLCNEKSPIRRAFGEHMKLIAHAMHEIEWVDSGDKSFPADRDAIKAVFEDLTSEKEMKILLDDARELIKQMKQCGA